MRIQPTVAEDVDYGPSPHGAQDRYRNYGELAAHEREDVDYKITLRIVPGARITIVAPHGGGIERGTSELACAVAGQDFNLYLFEGLKPKGNYKSLHITSRRFDEPRGVELIRRSELVVALHGCTGAHQAIYVGGLAKQIKLYISEKLLAAGYNTYLDGHKFPAIDRDNICNRGFNSAGIQLELTAGLRRTRPSAILGSLIHDLLLSTPI